jgi:hypothetical protein
MLMRYLFLFIPFLFCQVTTNAQNASTTRQDTVRCFVGKWINRNTFRIDSSINGRGGNGGVVKVKRDGSLDISTPESNKFDDVMKKAIEKIEDDEKDIANTVKADEGLYQFSMVSRSKKELDSLKVEFKALIIHPDEPPMNPQPVTPPSQNEFDRLCAGWEPEYHRIIDFYKAHMVEAYRPPHFDLPDPPVADYFNCWGCDTLKQKEFELATDQYVDAFFRDIDNDILTLLKIEKQLNNRGISPEAGSTSLNNMGGHPFPVGACAYLNYGDIGGAINFYVQREQQMASQLWKDHSRKNNYGSHVPAIKICLIAANHKLALGGTYPNQSNIMVSLADPIQELNDTLCNLLFKKRDFRFLGSLPLILSLEKEAMCFSAFNNVDVGFFYLNTNYQPPYSAQDVLDFTHFKLTVELDVKTGDNGSYTISHLKGSAKVIVDMDDKECIKFSLSKKEEGKLKLKIITNEAISPYPHGIYVGTQTYTSQSPIFKIRFCKVEGEPDGDSLYLSSFVPLAPDKGNWNVQGRMVPTGINQADRLFININELKNDAQNISPGVDQQKLEDIKRNSLEMAARLRAMQAAGNTDPAKMAEMVKQMMNNSNSVVETKTSEMMRIRLPLKVTNMDRVLVKQRFDAKEINTQMTNAIVYAYLTIKLQHDPGRNDDDE